MTSTPLQPASSTLAKGAESAWLAGLLLSFSAMSWAGNHVVARAIAGTVPPASVNLLRWLVVAVLVGLFAHRSIARDWPVIKRHWGVLFALGITGGGIFGTLQYVGLQYTSVINMGVLNSVAPPLMVLASFLTFRDPIRPVQILGVLTSLAGVLAMTSKLDWNTIASLAFNYGDIIIFVNMLLFAFYSACLRLRPPMALTSFLFVLAIAAAAVNVPWALYEHANGFEFVPSVMSFGAVGYAAVFTSIVAYLCWARGVDTLGAGRAGVFLHLIPVVNTIIGVSVLGEPFQNYHAIGLALILTGVWLTAAFGAPRKIVAPQAR